MQQGPTSTASLSPAEWNATAPNVFLELQAAERAEAQRRTAAAAAERRARSARLQDPSRVPMAVVMSDKQRQAVESLMQDLTLDVGDSSAVSNTGSLLAAASRVAEDDVALDSDRELQQAFIDGLVKAGFSLSDSTAAVKAVGTAAGKAAAAAAAAATAAAAVGGRGHTRVWRSHDGLQPYLDWLCIQLPVERLPAKYRPGECSDTVAALQKHNTTSVPWMTHDPSSINKCVSCVKRRKEALDSPVNH